MRERAPDAREGYALIIPELEAGKSGSSEMIKWLIGKSGPELLPRANAPQLFTMHSDCMADPRIIRGTHVIPSPCSLLIPTDRTETYVSSDNQSLLLTCQ